jgi:lysophospholipase L1-like esterase
MADNQNEGHSGWTISQVRNVLGPALNFKPNVVLIHLATNDLNGAETTAEPFSKAPERLGNVIDDVLKKLPNAVVFVAKIIPTTNSWSKDRFKTYNAALPAVVKARTDKGFSVVLVDQSVIPTSELSDSLHP